MQFTVGVGWVITPICGIDIGAGWPLIHFPCTSATCFSSMPNAFRINHVGRSMNRYGVDVPSYGSFIGILSRKWRVKFQFGPRTEPSGRYLLYFIQPLNDWKWNQKHQFAVHIPFFKNIQYFINIDQCHENFSLLSSNLSITKLKTKTFIKNKINK